MYKTGIRRQASGVRDAGQGAQGKEHRARSTGQGAQSIEQKAMGIVLWA
jgi:hypothetical protein